MIGRRCRMIAEARGAGAPVKTISPVSAENAQGESPTTCGHCPPSTCAPTKGTTPSDGRCARQS